MNSKINFEDSSKNIWYNSNMTFIRLEKESNDKEWSEHLDGFSTLPVHNQNKGFFPMLWEVLEIPIILIIVGILSAVVSLIINNTATYVLSLKVLLIGRSFSILSGVIFTLWTITLSLSGCLLTQMICSDAVGGGIPEIQAILSGTVKPVLLSKKLILAKGLGLICALCAGLSVGKEGPFIHMSVALADQIMRLPFFKNIRRQDSKRLELLACACGSGVAATFGTPFGGVLFSIELTSSAYNVKNLPRAFLAAVCTMLVFLSFGQQDIINLFNVKNFTIQTSGEVRNPLSRNEVIIFIFVGVICGLLGVAFVSFVEALSELKKRLLSISDNLTIQDISKRRYLLVFIVTLCLSPFLYIGFALGSQPPSQHSRVGQMFEPLNQPNESFSSLLIIFYISKFIETAFCVTLPLPVGLFTPVFLNGSVLGRILGEIASSIPNLTSIPPWEFAVVGAAAYATGVTRAISTAVIVFELSGLRHLRLPISLAVLASYFVGNRLSKNIYDVLSDTNGTPCLPDLPKVLYSVPVSKVMAFIDDTQVLSLDSTYYDAYILLQQSVDSETSYKKINRSNSYNKIDDGIDNDEKNKKLSFASSYVIPVVQSKESMVIVGAVLRDDLRRVIRSLIQMSDLARTKPVNLADMQPPDIRSRLSLSSTFASPKSTSSSESIRISPSSLSNSYLSFKNKDNNNLKDKSNYGSTNSIKKSFSRSQPIIEISEYGQNNYESKVENGVNAEDTYIYALDELIQYVLISDDGNSFIPVASTSAEPSSYSPSNRRIKNNRLSSWAAMSYAVAIDPSPYQIVDTMQLNKVNVIFRMLKLNQAYVTRNGRVVGIITRSIMREFASKFVKKPAEKFFDIINSFIKHITKSTNSDKNQTKYEVIPDININNTPLEYEINETSKL